MSVTPTNTFTFTHTLTNTNTPTRTFTSTSTLTPTPTSTSSFTVTATFTATRPIVQMGTGAGNPSNNTVTEGANNVPILLMQADNVSGETVQVNGITLNAVGTGNDASGILTLTIWKDGDGLGVLDGSTTALATVAAPYLSGNNIVVNFSDNIASGNITDYLITYSFSNAASAGTYGVNIPSGGISGQGTVSAKNLNVTGGQVNGAVLTIAASTATATSTATTTSSSTPMPTATGTSTATATKTATVSQKGSPTPIIYPNPSQGGPVQISVPGQGTGDVKVELFTSAFRKVQEADFKNEPLGVRGGVTILMTDSWGHPLASGLYYVVVTVTPAGGGAKYERLIGKLLLLR